MESAPSVLLVEDDPTVRNLVATFLDGLGCRVLEAGDARQALAAAEIAERIDVLLRDVILPDGCNGDLARLIDERHPGCVTIYLSGYTRDHVGELLGFEPENLLEKPFALSELAAAVRASTAARAV